jgi:hypothetical protein
MSYGWYIRTFGAKISIADFVHLYTARFADSKIRIAKAMDAASLQGEELYAGGYINPTAMPSAVSDVVTRLVIDRVFGNGFQ